jgi:multicomponent Na+:H+ antiporter subunit G
VIAAVLLVAGVAVATVSAVGAVLVRDARNRLHFLTPVTSVAGPLVGLALAFGNGWNATAVEVLVIVVLLAVTGPVLGAATGRLLAGDAAS